MLKKFFKEHNHLKFTIQQLGIAGGGWLVKIYNTTSGYVEPCYEHFHTNMEIDNLVVDFETAIMTPIILWWEKYEKEYRE